MSRLGSLGARLYRGEVGYDFVGKRKIWYGVSILITITAIVGLAVRGLNMGIEFEGGAVLTTPKTSASVQQTAQVAEESSGHQAIVQQLGDGGMRIQIAGVDTKKSTEVKEEISKSLKVDANSIDTQLVGPSWGKEIANKAWLGLGIFLVLVVIYLAIAFEWRMALAALIALIHDLTITVGVYSLVGFEVTPGTVIGLLTILGYSLYDTVVVFDGLREGSRNVTKQTRFTYSEIANRSINATLVRSINTTVVALLPVAGLLFIGGGLLGGGMLNDIALSLFVGLAAGAYSSIFIATPLVADFKEREPQMKALAKRVRAKRLKAEEREGGEGPGGYDDEDDQDPRDPAPGGTGIPVTVEDSQGATRASAGVVGTGGAGGTGGSAREGGGQRRQPASRGRGSRGRSSGKRR
ncbi:protein translocase subunit SecF [Streptomyces daliensis]|uniref:Protein-export membrane protein SecF n=1 Tax=Streptomyces daliensis TaxID=299421 RepID=A0A8T4IT54_9ACTN|nr:protein translocase subunit SecF [Streptomyces daliensis]